MRKIDHVLPSHVQHFIGAQAVRELEAVLSGSLNAKVRSLQTTLADLAGKRQTEPPKPKSQKRWNLSLAQVRLLPPEEIALLPKRFQPPGPNDRTLWPDQVALYYLNTSRQMVDRMARDGRLPGVIRLAQGPRKGMYKVNRGVLEKAMADGKIGGRR